MWCGASPRTTTAGSPTGSRQALRQGATAVSLRGLGSNNTLVLLNGRRLANNGFADDGQYSFVDLNTDSVRCGRPHRNPEGRRLRHLRLGRGRGRNQHHPAPAVHGGLGDGYDRHHRRRRRERLQGCSHRRLRRPDQGSLQRVLYDRGSEAGRDRNDVARGVHRVVRPSLHGSAGHAQRRAAVGLRHRKPSGIAASGQPGHRWPDRCRSLHHTGRMRPQQRGPERILPLRPEGLSRYPAGNRALQYPGPRDVRHHARHAAVRRGVVLPVQVEDAQHAVAATQHLAERRRQRYQQHPEHFPAGRPPGQSVQCTRLRRAPLLCDGRRRRPQLRHRVGHAALPGRPEGQPLRLGLGYRHHVYQAGIVQHAHRVSQLPELHPGDQRAGRFRLLPDRAERQPEQPGNLRFHFAVDHQRRDLGNHAVRCQGVA